MPRSPTTLGQTLARANAVVCFAFRHIHNVSTPNHLNFRGSILAYTLSYRRFTAALTDGRARLGADAGRYSFIEEDSQLVFLAGLQAHAHF